MNDERRGAPSASRLERLWLCPGSFELEKQAPPQPDNPDATSGTRIHAALAGEIQDSELDGDEAETAVRCRNLAAKLLEDTFPNERRVASVAECRMWHHNPTWSAKPDRVTFGEAGALVVDYKTGRNNAPQAASNVQIRACVALAHRQGGYGPNSTVVGAIVQPWCSPQISVVHYTHEDCQRALAEVNGVVERAKTETTRNPGHDQCRWCPAKLICDEFKTWAGGAALMGPDQYTPAAIEKPDVQESVIRLPGPELKVVLDRIKPMQWLIDAAKTEAKRRLEDGSPDAPEGWALKPGSVQETITDVATVFERLTSYDISPAEFTQEVTLTKAGLKRLLKAATDAKGKALDDLVALESQGCVESKQSAPTLVKEV